MTITKPIKFVPIVKGLVVNENQEILFVRRYWPERPDVHGKWELPGGQLDYGEMPDNTAVREVFEETGYKIKAVKVLPIIKSYYKEKDDVCAQIVINCYLCTLVGGKSLLGDHCVSEIKWFKLNEIPQDSDCLAGTNEFIEAYKGEYYQKV